MSETTLPTAKNDNSNQAIAVTDDGRMSYPSAAATGHVEIELPSLDGAPNPTERLLARNFGTHVASKVESAFKRQPYLESGAQQTPSQIFKHYVACARGAQLADPDTLKRMAQLASEFESEPEQGDYFAQVLKPWLYSLSPKRR